ncbi:Proteasome activator complex subunit 3 [Trichinella nativa]|uniref:Proteasome activator complex subunit 3 n=4 Tax=Trichinella TaxID=6333 RepID=A0A0V1L4A9_9BILA|nr:Proteasome activator complex subunit 3 [Trichinella murrelli]KRX55857.1 Proteasome activator complex subunit 3 [Trichinella sp. T9]KRY19407.1 Proteasome activator complex subunit 3 [Trichinella patagoniensis]KRY51060.1 Proteasome activator complex subunit 3 [Trichinella britovi]KRZ54377.1 Proteasome activator complex subunit 3 [Trichinella nativa]
MSERMTKWKEDLLLNTESMVLNEFPQRVDEINALINGEKFNTRRIAFICGDKAASQTTLDEEQQQQDDISDERTVLPTKRMKLEPTDNQLSSDAAVSTNKALMEMTQILYPIITNLMEEANRVKMWILFLIPKIEDGNNFGVSIQEDVLAEVEEVENGATTCLSVIVSYLESRAKMAYKMRKHPYIEDYRQLLIDLDKRQFINLRMSLIEVRNHYGAIHDLIVKNLDKIKKPRSNNVHHLY